MEGDDIVVASTLENLSDVLDGEAKSERLVTTVGVKTILLHVERHERDMTGIHSLDGHALGTDIDVGIVNEVLDRVNELLEVGGVGDCGFKHG